MYIDEGVLGMETQKRIAVLLKVFLVSVCLVACNLPPCEADEAPQPEGGAPANMDVKATVLAAKDKFQPITPEMVAASKSELAASIATLEEYLTNELGDADKWKTQLKWDALTSELAKDEPNLGTLNGSLNAFHEDVDGLEAEPFLETRELLRSYMNAVLFSGDAEQKTKQDYSKRVDDLVKQLETYAQTPSSETALQIGRHLGWFERTRQSPQVIKAVRKSYSHPNLFAEVSHRLFTAGIDDEVSQSQQISSFILGTSIYGTANINGRITTAFVPDPDRASFDLLLNGNI